MENENIENLDSPNQEEEVGLPEDKPEVEPIDEEFEEEDKDAIIASLKQKQQETYEQLKKAKGFVRDKDGKWVKKETLQVKKEEPKISEDVTRTELYSLMKANVPEEDTEETIIYAKSHGLTVTDALKTPELKAILRTRKEYRASAEAANMSGTRKGQSKPTIDQILEEARSGKISDVEALVEARMQKKIADLSKS